MLLGVDVDPHDLHRRIDAPDALLRVEPRADREHRIRLAPEAMSDRIRHGEPVRGRDHAAAAAIGDDGRLQPLGDALHLRPGILRAAADDDQRHAPPSPGCAAAASIASGSTGGASGGSGSTSSTARPLAPDVDRHLDRDRLRAPGAGEPDRMRHLARRLVRRHDPRRDAWSDAATARAGPGFHAGARARGRSRRRGSAPPARSPARPSHRR